MTHPLQAAIDAARRKRRARVGFLLPAIICLTLACLALVPLPARAWAQSGPRLQIAPNTLVAVGSRVHVPVAFTNGSTPTSAMLFSIDFDPACLAFDPVDANHDQRPDAVVFSPALPSDYTPSVAYSAADADGEIDIALVDLAPPFPNLPDGTLATITFTAVCTPSGSSTVTPVRFSSAPMPSFGGPQGQELDGTTADGSVTILPLPIAVTPQRPKVTVIDRCGVYGSVVFAKTPNVNYFITAGDGKQGAVTVAAQARSGYILQGYDGPWTYNLGVYSACPLPATPQRPKVTLIDACGTYGAVNCAETQGVTYSVEPPGAREGAVTVAAQAKPGYVLQGYDGPWRYNLGTYEPCAPALRAIYLPVIDD